MPLTLNYSLVSGWRRIDYPLFSAWLEEQIRAGGADPAPLSRVRLAVVAEGIVTTAARVRDDRESFDFLTIAVKPPGDLDTVLPPDAYAGTSGRIPIVQVDRRLTPTGHTAIVTVLSTDESADTYVSEQAQLVADSLSLS